MSTSGTDNFNQTAVQILTDALMLLGRLGEGQTISTNALSFGMNLLNKLVKSWEPKGLHCWTSSYGTLFLNQGQQKYTINGSSGDYVCDDATLVETSLTSPATGNTLAVVSTVGMSVGDNIGVELDSAVRFWTTIASIGSSTSVTLTSNLTGTASTGRTVFSFTNFLDRPLNVFSAMLRNSSGFDRPIKLDGQVEYNQIPNKLNQAPPNRAYYSPQQGYGLMYTWGVCDSTISNRIKFCYARSIQDFNSSTDNPDLPDEWLHALTLNMARVWAPAYGIDLTKKDPNDILRQAQEALNDLMAWDSEQSSVFIVPNDRYDI